MKKLVSILMVAAFMAVLAPVATNVANAVTCVHYPYVIAMSGLTAEVMQNGSISLLYTDFLASPIGFAPGRGEGCSVIWYGFADDAGKVTQGPTTGLSLEFTCADVNQPRQIEIAACSEAGCDYAITFVQIQDNRGFCEGVAPAPTVPPFPVMFTVPSTPTPTLTPTPTPTPGPANNFLTFALQTIGDGPATFEPINGAMMKVYNVADSAFTAAYGATSVGWKTKLNLIYEGGVALISSCATDDGACVANKPAPGSYLVVGKYVDGASNKTVYISKQETAADFDIDQNAYVDLKVQKHFKKGVFEKYGPAGQIMVVQGVAVAKSGILAARIGAMSLGSLLLLVVGFGLGLAFQSRNKLFKK